MTKLKMTNFQSGTLQDLFFNLGGFNQENVIGGAKKQRNHHAFWAWVYATDLGVTDIIDQNVQHCAHEYYVEHMQGNDDFSVEMFPYYAGDAAWQDLISRNVAVRCRLPRWGNPS